MRVIKKPSQGDKPATTNESQAYVINTSIALIIYVTFSFILPPLEPVTKGGMGVLGVFLAMMYLLFVAENVTWPCFMAVGLLGFTNVTSAANIIGQSWGSVMTVFVVATLLLNYAMTETGLIRRVAIWFITRKFLKGHPWMMLFMYFLSILLLGLVCTSSPIVVMYIAISEGIFDTLGYEGKEDKFTRSIVLAIGWVAQGAQAMTPIGHTMVLMVFGFILKDFGVTISIAKFSMVFLAWGAVYHLGTWLVFRYVMRPDVSRLVNLDIDELKAEVPPMSRREKIVSIVLIALVIFWISPDMLALIPLMKPIASFVSKMGQTIPALVAVGLLCALRADGAPALDLKLSSSRIMWGSVYMIASLQVFGFIFDLDTVGITAAVRETLKPLSANLPAWAFVAMVTAFMLIATNFLSNAVCAMLYTVIMPLALLIPGVSPIAIGLIVASSANADSLLTPASCPVSGLVIGSGYVSPGMLAKYGWILMIVAFIGYIFVGYPLAVAVFG